MRCRIALSQFGSVEAEIIPMRRELKGLISFVRSTDTVIAEAIIPMRRELKVRTARAASPAALRLSQRHPDEEGTESYLESVP